MLVSLVDKRDDRFAIQIIEPSADERKTVSGQVAHFRSEIDFTVEPRFNGVLVQRGTIDKVRGEK